VNEKRLNGCSNSAALLGSRRGEEGEDAFSIEIVRSFAFGVSRGGKDKNISPKCFVSAESLSSGICAWF